MREWLVRNGRLARHGQDRFHLRDFLPFKEARAFARSLNLKSEAEWLSYIKSGKGRDDIPAAPSRNVWKGWLGWNWRLARYRQDRTPLIANFDLQGSPCVCACLNLKSGPEWRQLWKVREEADDIPTIRTAHTPRPAGPEWATGSVRTLSLLTYESIYRSRKPAPPCATSI